MSERKLEASKIAVVLGCLDRRLLDDPSAPQVGCRVVRALQDTDNTTPGSVVAKELVEVLQSAPELTIEYVLIVRLSLTVVIYLQRFVGANLFVTHRILTRAQVNPQT